MTSIAILGLGTMGSGMAANLLKAGYAVTVYNRSPAKAEKLLAHGARIAHTPHDAAEGAEMIVSMVADDTGSRALWLGENGALAGASAGTILIESSTVSPQWIAELAEHASQRGLELLDAPVTGSRTQAETGQLSFLVGGSRKAFDRAASVFHAMGKDSIYLGQSGSGAVMKLINNFLCGVQVASLAQGLSWIERSGLDPQQALTILKNGAPGSPLLAAISGRMTQREYAVNFHLNLMSKDLLYAHEAAASQGIDLSTAISARLLFEEAIAEGYGAEDMSAVVEVARAAKK